MDKSAQTGINKEDFYPDYINNTVKCRGYSGIHYQVSPFLKYLSIFPHAEIFRSSLKI